MKWPWVSRKRLDIEARRAGFDARASDEALAKEAEDTAYWMREYRRVMGEYRAVMETVAPATERATASEAATIRAEVRAAEWEAIAKELIAAGMGRPRPDSPARTESLLAKKIREEAAGDPSLASHYWRFANDLKRQGKTAEEIVGMIGWTTADPPEAVTPP